MTDIAAEGLPVEELTTGHLPSSHQRRCDGKAVVVLASTRALEEQKENPSSENRAEEERDCGRQLRLFTAREARGKTLSGLKQTAYQIPEIACGRTTQGSRLHTLRGTGTVRE